MENIGLLETQVYPCIRHWVHITGPSGISPLSSFGGQFALSSFLQASSQANKNLMAKKQNKTWWPKCQDVIYPANLSSSPPPWDFLEPPQHFPLHCSSGPQKHLSLLFSLFKGLNKKSKKISRKEAEKKRASKVGMGVLTVGMGLDLKGEDPQTLVRN